MKKTALVLLMSLVSTASIAAFQGPSTVSDINTVAQAKQAKHDQYVSLTGNIIASLGDENYQFKDSTGEIRIEIDDDDWGGVNATPTTKVTIHGEIDKYMGGVEIDVDSIQLAQ